MTRMTRSSSRRSSRRSRNMLRPCSQGRTLRVRTSQDRNETLFYKVITDHIRVRYLAFGLATAFVT